MEPKTYQFLVGIFASLGSALFGYDLGVIAGVIGSDSYINQFQPEAPQNGGVVATFTAGAFVGAGLAGPSGDKFGRRLTIMAGAIIFLVGGALQTAAQTLNYLYAGRLIAGVGVGFLTMIIPVYQSEIVHPSIRGRVTGLQQFMLGIGALIAGWTTYGTHIGLSDSAQWRVPLGIQMLPAAILAPLILLFPESPRWLLDHDRAEEGLRALARLHARGDTSDAWVQAEYAQIQEAITFEHDHEAKSYKELFVNKSSFRRLLIACALQAATQMTGVSAIQYFSPTIFKQIGINTDDTLKYQAISSVLALIAQATCMATIDKFGRRWVVINGMLFNGLMFLIATILLAKFPPETNSAGTAGWGFIIVTWLYNISFSYATGPLSWIVPAEIFDTHTRSKGVSIATMTSFAFNTMIGQVTDIAMKAVGWRFFILFIVCNFTNALFFFLVLPETKKLPLEEMNYLFTNAPWLVPGTDKASYSAGLAADIERRAAEVREKREPTADVSHIN
ncbi:general substrate transporter [Microdochium trichocladiopsis]|uniref:General substrate transporter n=1 Tax=Microdochium trichocladiopsis TaxID=1682393 RepID=A0A9P8Y0T1_9PEZI|nr:general substrate transporter [Microdochium trichocladiopsis]KAH7026420.1 general substrate transporter [Microdochium trichocladiopsis]